MDTDVYRSAEFGQCQNRTGWESCLLKKQLGVAPRLTLLGPRNDQKLGRGGLPSPDLVAGSIWDIDWNFRRFVGLLENLHE